MKYKVLLIILTGCLAACTNPPHQPPQHVLSEDTLIQIIMDIRLLEGAYSLEYKQVDTSSHKIESYYSLLFSKYGINRQQFEDSYLYYSTQPGKLAEIESEVMNKLSEKQAVLESNQ